MRRSMKVVGAAVLAAGLWALPAQAEGIGHPSLEAADAPASFSWTGIYVGAHAGHGWADWNGDLTYDPGTGPFQVFDPAERTLSGSGWLGGGQIGINKQVGSFVFGVELDGSWTNIEGDQTFTSIDFADDGKKDYSWGIKTKIDAFGTARLRAGIANGPMLFYATGGLAFARTSADLTVKGHEGQGFPADGEVTAVGSASENHLGYAVGGGMEWAMGHGWSLKTEYLYLNFGEADYRLTGTAYPGTKDLPHTTDSFPATLDMHVVRAGLNYKF